MRLRRRAEHPWRIVAAAVVLVPVACSSSSSSDGAADAGDAYVRDPAKNCVKPGSPGNEKGIGAYCEPGGAPCVGDAGSLLVCTGGFPGVPDTAWFCTRGCTVDQDCGTDAFCLSNSLGTGCVPRSCLPADAGVDAAND